MRLVDEFYVWSRLSIHPDTGSPTWAASTVSLTLGRDYTVEVAGNWEAFDETPDLGSPDAIMFPHPLDLATLAEIDAEVRYAWWSGASPATYPEHIAAFWWNINNSSTTMLDADGVTWYHPEPVGGPFSSPQPDHTYTYEVVGHGLPLRASLSDTTLSDNSGQLRIRIFDRGGPVVGHIGFG